MLSNKKFRNIAVVFLLIALVLSCLVIVARVFIYDADNDELPKDAAQTPNIQQTKSRQVTLPDDIDESDEGVNYGEREILVTLKGGVSADALVDKYDFIEGIANTTVSKQDSSTFVFKLARDMSVKRAIEILKDDSDIEMLQPNYIYHLTDDKNCTTNENVDHVDTVSNIETMANTDINDTYYKNGVAWSLTDSNANMFDAWDFVKNEHANTVAVIDTGIDTDHPDLVNNIVEASSSVSEENDPNFYFSAEDIGYHGTHVSGIISAEANNGIGVAGISYNANIMSVRAFYGAFDANYNWRPTAKSADIAAAINHVIEMRDAYNVKVINMSLGMSNTSADKPPADDYIMLGAIDKAYVANIYCVVATGNDSTASNLKPVSFPAYYDKVISVGAIGANHSKMDFSNGSKELDVVAPGNQIISTVPMYNDGATDDGYLLLPGTSMAAPYVSATASLCFVKNPNLSFDQLYDCLTKTAVDLGDLGFDNYYGYGQVVPLKAAEYANSLNNGDLIELHKGGNDADCFNILVAGDGYTSSEQDKFINDAKWRVDNLFNFEPYKMFKNSINVYAVKCISNESGINKDTYFGIDAQGGRSLGFRSSAYTNKARSLKDDLAMQLGNTKGWGTFHILVNDSNSYGASQNFLFSFSSISQDSTDGSVMAHEMAHSIGRLGDEYDKKTDKYNIDQSTKTADNIKWKEFLGFKGIGIAPGNATDGSVVIPSPYCLMRELTYSMCEVCKAQMAWYLNESLYRDNRDDYYVTDLDLTIEHSKTGTFNDTYKNYVINNKTIKKANGHTLELRGIFQNMKANIEVDGDNPFNLELSLVIKNAEGKVRVEKIQDFAVDNCTYNYDRARKSLSVSVDVGETQLYSGYTIEGTLVDKDSRKVLAVFDGGEPGAVEPEPDICEHEHTELRNILASTCTIPGYSGDKYCKDCGELLEKGNDLPLDPSNHVHLEDIEGKEATCETPGYTAYQRCVDCGLEIRKVLLPKEDHKYDETGYCIWCGKKKDPAPEPSEPEATLKFALPSLTEGTFKVLVNGLYVDDGTKIKENDKISVEFSTNNHKEKDDSILCYFVKRIKIGDEDVFNIDDYDKTKWLDARRHTSYDLMVSDISRERLTQSIDFKNIVDGNEINVVVETEI